MTDAIARPLAQIVSVLHPGWEVPGVAAEIHRARHLAPPAELIHAAIDWALMRPNLRAPTGLSEDGPWWHTGRTPSARVEPTRCAVYGHEHELAHNCRSCRAEALGLPENRTDTLALPPEQVATNAAGAALVRGVLATREDMP